MSYSYFYFLEVTMSIINIKNLSFNYDGSHDNIFENVSLQIDTNWKLGLVGRNGKGKTTLLKLLLGDLEYRGNIQSSVKFEYFPFSINNKDNFLSTKISRLRQGRHSISVKPDIDRTVMVQCILQGKLSLSGISRNNDFHVWQYAHERYVSDRLVACTIK